MRREADGSALLIRLLERHERGSGARRIIERPAQSGDPASLRALTELLEDAAGSGAVEVHWDREAPHLIERVVLKDPDRLYAYTGRLPGREVLNAAIDRVVRAGATTDIARAFVHDLTSAWSNGRRLLTLGVEDVEGALSLIRAMDAAFTELPPDIPPRTRSARLLGDSKALERSLPSIIAYLRLTGMVHPDLSANAALEQLGLAKFPPPVLVGGPLTVGAADVAAWPYAGIPPELVTTVATSALVRSILTIENLESFNRHVRTMRQAGDIVVYSGGFPSQSVVAMLRALLPMTDGVLHHWGDVDPGGIRIGRHLETTLGAVVKPHLMTVELARTFGSPPKVRQAVPPLPQESAFIECARYLHGDDALWLEQEVVDPLPVQPGSNGSMQ